MADTEQENAYGFADKRRTPTQSMLPGTIGASANYDDVGSLRARLAAVTVHGAGYYSTARLNAMTKNDMVYALRLADDAAGI